MVNNEEEQVMSRRGENIHKRKDGRWEARVSIIDECGESHKISLYGKTYREAKEKKLLVIDGQAAYNGKSLGKTFAQVAQEWLDSNFINQKKSTRLKYQEMIIRHINPELGRYKINLLTEKRINIFILQKLKSGRICDGSGLSSSYVKTMGIIINCVMQYAAAQNYCRPFKLKIYKPVSEHREVEILDIDTQKALEHCLENDTSLTALGIEIALNTGLRIGEICALKWEDIDMENAIIHVRHTIARIENADPNSGKKTCLVVDSPKTKTSIRDIPITKKLYKSLENITERVSTYFVVSGSEKFISPRTFEYRYHKLLENCCIPSINFHGLRHTFATRCVEFNVDIKSLSEILGHANTNITLNTYVHSSLELKRNQLEKLSMMCE